MKLAVIPARGGSKRIPGKNIREFRGRPIIAWSIDAARDSGCFDRIVVSTDDDAVAEVARGEGALVPFRRPPPLADDYASTIPVIAHAISWHEAHGMVPDHVCCIYATAPMLRAADIRTGMAALEDADIDYAFAVTSYAFPIQRAIRLDAADRVEMFDPDQWSARSQDLEEAFHDAGQFYWGRADAWRAGRPVFSERSVGVRIPRHRVQDIDTDEDWVRAELLAEAGSRLDIS